MLFDLMQEGAERLRRFALYALLHYGLLIKPVNLNPGVVRILPTERLPGVSMIHPVTLPGTFAEHARHTPVTAFICTRSGGNVFSTKSVKF